MKTKYFLSIIMTATYMTLFAQAPALHTYDFSAVNAKGDTIYYLITSPKTVAVSFRCDSATSQPNSSYLIWYLLNPIQRNIYKGNLTVPEKVSWQSVEYRITTVAAYTFYNVPLTSVSLPQSIDSIGNNNFSYCSGLKKLTLPDSVSYIGDKCFQSLDLEEVKMGDLIRHLGTGCFNNSGIRRFICPPLITKINGSVVACPNLSEVILPEGLDTIDSYSFFTTPSLKNICFPNTLVHLSGFNSSGLNKVMIPASVRTVIGFSGCSDLHSVEFLGETDSIVAFGENDTNLHFLDLSATRIRVWKTGSLFNKTMRSIILPQSLKKIDPRVMGYYACENQAEHTPFFSLVIPKNVDSIDVNAWVNTYMDPFAKGELILKSSVPATIPASFRTDKPYPYVQVYVPCGSLEAYKSDKAWNYFYPNIREVDMEEVILDSLCEYQVQAKYGFLPDKSGVYTVVRSAADSLHCDTLSIYYIKLFKSTVADTSVQVYDDGTAFEWTWEGNGEEYDVLRNGDFVASVQEPYYRDTAVETGVQYCYNFIPYLNGCRGLKSQTNCYTRVQDDSSSVKTLQKHTLSLYPNPAKQSLFLTNGERYDNTSYEITDVTGRMVLQGSYNATEGIRVSGLAKGVYLLRMEGKVGKFGKN